MKERTFSKPPSFSAFILQPSSFILHVFGLASLFTSPLTAKNVDLATVPPRDSVQLTIYNAEDITLVRETRVLPFRRGVNPLQFSWANTLIDPTSVEIQFPKAADKLALLDTTFPHDKPQMLYWNVESEEDGDATVEITYFTSGITWSADYIAATTPDETRMNLTGYVRVQNGSGEQYENAQVRLVVGTINLVELISELARCRYGVDFGELEGDKRLELKAGAVEHLFSGDAFNMGDFAGGMGGSLQVPKDVAKESLGEYFIYTVEGTETISDGWSKRMLSFEGRDVPFKTEYRFRPEEYGDELVRLFVLTNDKEHKLGSTPLPDGVVHTYRDNGRDGLSFLGQQDIHYVPIGDKIELNLGSDPEVIHEQVPLKVWRDNFWFHRAGLDVYRNLKGQHRIEVDDEVAGWEDHTRFVERIRNYRTKPIEVEIRRSFEGHAIFASKLEPKLHDFRTVQFSALCPPGRKTDLPYHLRNMQQYLAKQENVTLEAGE